MVHGGQCTAGVALLFANKCGAVQVQVPFCQLLELAGYCESVCGLGCRLWETISY